MNTLHERLSDTRSDARTQKITKVDKKLNKKILELADQRKEKVVVSVTGVIELVDIHERTLRSIGFPGIYDNKLESCTWEKWNGLKIHIPSYLVETEQKTEEEVKEMFGENCL